jgi:hypothetical protein
LIGVGVGVGEISTGPGVAGGGVGREMIATESPTSRTSIPFCIKASRMSEIA